MTPPLTDLLRIELPIVQAPMAGVQGSALAIAVCNAGGLGSLPAAMLGADGLRKELTAIREQTTSPFNVNFFCHTPPRVDAAREAAWRAVLRPYYDEMGIDLEAMTPAASRKPFDAATAELIAEFEPPVVSFHFGLPSDELLTRVRRWGAKVLSTATTLTEAKWLAARGMDAIIAQGSEAGGHRGMFLSEDLSTQLSTADLVRQIAATLDVPTIAAGGIGDAGDVAAALNLGAAGVQIGTAYLLCPECTTHAVHRAALQSDAGKQTAITNIFTGRPARGIINRAIRELGPINPLAPPFPLAAAAIAPLRAKAEAHGSGDFSPMWAGQNGSGCRTIPAGELTRSFFAR